MAMCEGNKLMGVLLVKLFGFVKDYTAEMQLGTSAALDAVRLAGELDSASLFDRAAATAAAAFLELRSSPLDTLTARFDADGARFACDAGLDCTDAALRRSTDTERLAVCSACATLLSQKHLTPAVCDAVTEACRADLSLCLLYTSPSPRDRQKSRMPSSA